MDDRKMPGTGRGHDDLPTDDERRSWADAVKGLLSGSSHSAAEAAANCLSVVDRGGLMRLHEKSPPRRGRCQACENAQSYDSDPALCEDCGKRMTRWQVETGWVRSRNDATLRSLIAHAVMFESDGIPKGAARLVEHIGMEWGVSLPHLPKRLADVPAAATWVAEQRGSR